MQVGPENKVCAFGRAESKVGTHQHQPRGVPKTVGIRTTIIAEQSQPKKVVSPLLGLRQEL